MEFRHLRYFLVLAEELHFGRAARRLAISQPPLSLNIRQLEESVGARLFHRNSKEVRLTSAGQAFVPAARALIDQAAEARRHVRLVGEGFEGQLRVGFVSSMLYRGLPQMVRTLQERYPQLRLSFRELSSHEQVVALTHGQLEAGFVHTQRVPSELGRLLFSSEPFVCCLPIDHALAPKRALAVRALEHERFVMFSRAVSPDYHERVLSICTDAGFSPDIRHEGRHWLSVTSMVAQGLGVALVPAALQRSGIEGAAFVALEPVKASSQVALVWRRQQGNPALDAFLEMAREVTEGDAKERPRPPTLSGGQRMRAKGT